MIFLGKSIKGGFFTAEDAENAELLAESRFGGAEIFLDADYAKGRCFFTIRYTLYAIRCPLNATSVTNSDIDVKMRL
jgi:hypothetical protein